ncbi:MAG: hypothetical protein GY714_25095, partial [Desulfobacterales bacterium]|nr:hypothetical protein [Desulfobacterales bacterium]
RGHLIIPPCEEDDKNESIKKDEFFEDLGRDLFDPFAREKEGIIWMEMMVGGGFS